MRHISVTLLLLVLSLPCRAAVYYITVAGLGGEPDYEQRFTADAKNIDKVYRGSAAAHVITLSGADATKAKLTAALNETAREAKPEDDLVLVLIGHGSFDGEEYKFNLVGPDISATELASALDKIAARRQLVVNTTSASGGSLLALQRTGRAVITATKTGTEKNATVFARYWLQALQDPACDTDKSGAISALEAFTYADRKTAEFYSSQKRLATEHAVFEDMGKGEAVRTITQSSREGSLLGSFTVLRMDGGNAAVVNDPAHQTLLAKKEELERKVDQLKYEKAVMEPGEYKQALTATLLELAKVQQELEK
ncbi:hypothetical protein [Terriglobus tenax]|uniref:hypothetical protein n=1 Tax=Terriglobus tenax TaxID=1111115 RepID=UPI0021E0017D|nr:hypothetical protein [Terriglobus tenax]